MVFQSFKHYICQGLIELNDTDRFLFFSEIKLNHYNCPLKCIKLSTLNVFGIPNNIAYELELMKLIYNFYSIEIINFYWFSLLCKKIKDGWCMGIGLPG